MRIIPSTRRLERMRRQSNSRLGRSLGIPPLYSCERRGAIERRVHFDRIKPRSVKGQIFALGQSFGIERAGPSCRRECACPNPDFRHWRDSSPIMVDFANADSTRIEHGTVVAGAYSSKISSVLSSSFETLVSRNVKGQSE